MKIISDSVTGCDGLKTDPSQKEVALDASVTGVTGVTGYSTSFVCTHAHVQATPKKAAYPSHPSRAALGRRSSDDGLAINPSQDPSPTLKAGR